MLFTSKECEQLKEALKAHVLENSCGAKVRLTPGQCLLMLIDAAEKHNLTKDIRLRLERLYLEGAENPAGKVFIAWMSKKFSNFKKWHVTCDWEHINKDESRRYFETHLAYNLLVSSAESLNLTALRVYVSQLEAFLYQQVPDIDSTVPIQKILRADIDCKYDSYQFEYAYLINQLIQNDYHHLSPKACSNLLEIARITILSTIISQQYNGLPADVYDAGLFDQSVYGRGRRLQQDQISTRSSTFGLMKSTSRVPYDDISFREPWDFYPYTRSVDCASFMPASPWAGYVFERLTQIYANGISSTTLATLRNLLLHFRRENPLNIDLQDFFTIYSALMVFNSGGHSFFEIFEVFKYPQFAELGINQFSGSSSKPCSLTSWLMESQESSFKKALTGAMNHNQDLLKRILMNAQISKNIGEITEYFSLNAHQALLDNQLEYFKFLLPKNINVKYDIGEQELSLIETACLMGRLDFVKYLIKKGAEDHRALYMAVRGEHAHVIKYLLEKNCSGVENALIWAASRRTLEPLTLILSYIKHSKTDFSLGLVNALNQAVKADNYRAAKIIWSYVQPKLFEGEIQDFLNMAASAGNLEMVKLILPKSLDDFYNIKVFYVAHQYGFFPVAKHILEHLRITLDNRQWHEIFRDTVKLGNLELVKYLLEVRPEMIFKAVAFHEAYAGGFASIAELVLDELLDHPFYYMVLLDDLITTIPLKNDLNFNPIWNLVLQKLSLEQKWDALQHAVKKNKPFSVSLILNSIDIQQISLVTKQKLLDSAQKMNCPSTLTVLNSYFQFQVKPLSSLSFFPSLDKNNDNQNCEMTFIVGPSKT